MTSLTSRLYQPADLHSMVALCRTLRQNGQKIYPIAADLHEELADPAVQETARVWLDDRQQLAGFAYVNCYQNLVDVFTAGEFSTEIEEELIAWVVSAVQRRKGANQESQSLDASALEFDHSRIAFLERHGFERLPESSLLLACSLDHQLPEPQLPEGFAIRPVAGEAEIGAYVALHQAAFGTRNMTAAYRQAVMRSPGYIPELDLVVRAPNGDLAAFCVCQIFPDDSPRAGGLKEGWTDPVGTHPEYQRKGLAKALILTGMQLLQERGVDTALLGTGSTNLPMQALARSAGFQTASTSLWFCKEV